MTTKPTISGGVWVDLPKKSTVDRGWSCIVVDNGVRIISFGEKYQAGDSVTIVDPDGRELAHYDKQEWKDEAEQVMGCIILLASSPGTI